MKLSPFHGIVRRRAYCQQSSSRWPARGIALLLLSSLSACGSGTDVALPPSTEPIPENPVQIVAPAELNRDFVSVAPEAKEFVMSPGENIEKTWIVDSITKPNGESVEITKTMLLGVMFYETYASLGPDLNLCSESEWFWNYQFTATTLQLTREAAVLPTPRPVRTYGCPGPDTDRPILRDLLRNGASWRVVRSATGRPDALIFTGTAGDTEGWVLHVKNYWGVPM